MIPRPPHLKPHPGSREAEAEGCNCPVLDNSYGKGRYGDGEAFGWWINFRCPIHGDRRLLSEAAAASD
jgi:hypothetical protein